MASENPDPNIAPEWSSPFKANAVTKAPVRVEISADEVSREALLRRLNVVSIVDISAKLTLRRQEGGRIVYIKGWMSADLVQACVVSGKDVPAQIKEEEIEGWYADPEEAVSINKVRREKEIAHGHGERPIIEEREDPEPFYDGKINLGEFVIQNLILALNPYPHAEGEHYKIGDDDVKPEKPTENNPFAALKDWKDNIE